MVNFKKLQKQCPDGIPFSKCKEYLKKQKKKTHKRKKPIKKKNNFKYLIKLINSIQKLPTSYSLEQLSTRNSQLPASYSKLPTRNLKLTTRNYNLHPHSGSFFSS